MTNGQGARSRHRARKAQLKQALKKEAKKRDNYMSSLPRITPHDLLNFQIAHFGDDSTPVDWFVKPEIAINFASAYKEGDDGLGYYDDGVKRTLTDEQIAMFRRTELWQQHRKETLLREAQEEGDANLEASSKMPPQKRDERASHSTLDQPASRSSKEKEQVESRSESPSINETWKERRSGKEIPYEQRHKRKWEQFVVKDDETEGSLTHRRLVRELDDQKPASIEMDY